MPFKDVAFEAVADTVRTRQYNPLRAARALTAMSVAQAQAVQQASVAPPATQQMVARQAAAGVLVWLFPQEAHVPWLVGLLPTGAEPDQSTAAMQAVAQVIERSLTDGADARRRPLAKPSWRPGLWQRTPPLLAEQPSEPQAPRWRPWCPGTETLQPPDPPPHGSAAWRNGMTEVRDVRERLTVAQKLAALRWNLDAGSVTPPGVWNIVVRTYLAEHPVPPVQHYRMLALLNMAMHDALVAGWRVKLTHWTERPYTAIRRDIDPAFEPFLLTPPFPGYVSGHAVVSGAAAEVLARLLPEARERWQALAREAADSRLWGGIHSRFDNEEGLRLGQRVAQTCLDQFEDGEVDAMQAASPLITVPAGTPAYSSVLPRKIGVLE
ncbi:vanadium-dependent haloperoxidase [Methyloversatilis sp.]|uniref:vanadium-dependent haloperoxidase n=1 Tax=Methyloversatilis sp. TaxID=2569862 RepID=UPI002735C4E5|nr:vanadium-dependent haloperoxidase [Methyloversatilis sp.]MDP3457037.1 vanadium-dependent haloperoxidase [Methyloversatilis sp.]